jgi:short-chain fatty acids transporter
MAMIVIGGYVVASSTPVARIMRWLASIPRTPRGAVAFVAFVSMTSALVSWGFSLVFSAFLVREVAQRVRGVDYRAAGAAAYLGVGSVWALGLSSSAALLMASSGSIPPELFKISSRIPLTQAIFTWQSGLTALIVIAVSVGVAYLSAPSGPAAKTAETLGVNLMSPAPRVENRRAPGEWLDHSGILTLLICAMGFSLSGKGYLC